MRTLLAEEERTRLDRRVAEAESRTGAQVVLAVAERSDVYAEIPWKAFALGTGAGGMTVVLLDLLLGAWTFPTTVPLAVAAALVPGAASALLCVLVPAVARIFLDGARADVETRQYADSLFLSRELFATSGRTGVLLFASMFERKVVVLPDSGLSRRLPKHASQAVIDAMTGVLLAGGEVAAALEAGLAALERHLAAGSGNAGSGGNELPNAPIEEGRP